MEWQVIVALVIAVPVILFPVVFIWFINIGGIIALVKEARAKRAARIENRKQAEAAVQEKVQ